MSIQKLANGQVKLLELLNKQSKQIEELKRDNLLLATDIHLTRMVIFYPTQISQGD